MTILIEHEGISIHRVIKARQEIDPVTNMVSYNPDVYVQVYALALKPEMIPDDLRVEYGVQAFVYYPPSTSEAEMEHFHIPLNGYHLNFVDSSVAMIYLEILSNPLPDGQVTEAYPELVV